MKKPYAATLAMILGLTAAGVSRADDMKPKPGVVEARSASLTGTVDSIDYKTRQVVLKTADGLVPMEVGPEAARFNEVKKGDTVKIDYLESVAVMVADPHSDIGSAQASGKVIV